MKTKEELTALKNEVKNLKDKLADLNEEELEQVTGGFDPNNQYHWDTPETKDPYLPVADPQYQPGEYKPGENPFSPAEPTTPGELPLNPFTPSYEPGNNIPHDNPLSPLSPGIYTPKQD